MRRRRSGFSSASRRLIVRLLPPGNCSSGEIRRCTFILRVHLAQEPHRSVSRSPRKWIFSTWMLTTFSGCRRILHSRHREAATSVRRCSSRAHSRSGAGSSPDPRWHGAQGSSRCLTWWSSCALTQRFACGGYIKGRRSDMARASNLAATWRRRAGNLWSGRHAMTPLAQSSAVLWRMSSGLLRRNVQCCASIHPVQSLILSAKSAVILSQWQEPDFRAHAIKSYGCCQPGRALMSSSQRWTCGQDARSMPAWSGQNR